MSPAGDTNPGGGASRPASPDFDTICEKFETAWQEGRQPRLEDYLDEYGASDPGALLAELLPIELDQRRRHGEHPQGVEFARRFMQHIDIVRRYFPELSAIRPAPATKPFLPETIPGLLEAELDSVQPLKPRSAQQPKILPALVDHPRYQVVQLLGVGGMGAVYEAVHRMMDRRVALKVVNESLVSEASAAQRFQREVKAAARLMHPNIVAAYDAEQVGKINFLVMELVEGTDLATMVYKRGPLPVKEACEYIRQAALGLEHARERSMVHRDIKPANIMVTPTGQVKILDFGLARFVSESGLDSRLTHTDTMLGTADFVSPEQAESPQKADSRSDIYSLGCALYFLLASHPPFYKRLLLDKLNAHATEPLPKLAEQCADVPPAVDAILAKMTAKDPAKRYQTPAEVAAAFDALLRGELAKAAPAKPKKNTTQKVKLAATARYVPPKSTMAQSRWAKTSKPRSKQRQRVILAAILIAIAVAVYFLAIK